MKINPINKINFEKTSKNNIEKSEIDKKIGFSDSVSDNTRKEIRQEERKTKNRASGFGCPQ